MTVSQNRKQRTIARHLLVTAVQEIIHKLIILIWTVLHEKIGLFGYIQCGHKVKISDSNMVADTGPQQNGQTALFGVILAPW